MTLPQTKYFICISAAHGETKNIQNPSKTVHIKPAMRYSSSIMVDPNDIVGKYGSGLSGICIQTYIVLNLQNRSDVYAFN